MLIFRKQFAKVMKIIIFATKKNENFEVVWYGTIKISEDIFFI